MKHFRFLNGLFLFTFIVLSCGCGVFFSDPDCDRDSGFSIAYFSKESIQQLLRVNGAEAIRFYSVRRSHDDEGTVMAVALNGERREIEMSYSCFERLDQDAVQMRNLDVDEACQFFFHMLYSGKDGCIVEVPRAEMEKLLIKDHNAIQVQSLEMGTDPITMHFQAAKLSRGQVTLNNTHYYKGVAPCPEECGHYQTFVCTNRRS